MPEEKYMECPDSALTGLKHEAEIAKIETKSVNPTVFAVALMV
jgi:hypothetical protein